jgi:hypothetical protein
MDPRRLTAAPCFLAVGIGLSVVAHAGQGRELDLRTGLVTEENLCGQTAQDGLLRVVVSAEGWKPLPEFRVTILDSEKGTVQASQKTDRNGAVVFQRLRPARGFVVVAHSQFKSLGFEQWLGACESTLRVTPEPIKWVPITSGSARQGGAVEQRAEADEVRDGENPAAFAA